MDFRPPLVGTQRPRPPQRAVSGGSYGGHPLPKRPPLPSRLSNVRSVSQPVDIVDLTSHSMRAEGGGGGGLLAGGSREEVVKSPEVIDLEDDGDVEQPPAKRAKMVGNEFQAAEEGGEAENVDMAHEIMPGNALPTLPKARPCAGKMGAYRRNRFGIEPSARKAHGVDPPAAATRVPPPKKVLDFSPWTGSHQEDVLNDNIVKVGYFDKINGTNQSETNSAKSSIWPSLSQKNHAGLSALSYMYVAVMEKRQAAGKCTAPSTFKPPPRLAVQEAKRAKWLEDLADPSVSLRRLSKTIPHGIKGKLLMEQCLGKFIPLHRALWLVRGVGMHELRAFRRKGFNEAQAASGEVKWVRDWTEQVTHFLVDVMEACGQPDWQKKMNYAVKLATALYSERLLDADYYLDWIVSSLAESTIGRLPVWIIITQIHWKDLTAFGRRGRRLAEGILEHLHGLNEARISATAPVRLSLQKMVTVLAVASRGCLILPRMWQKYRDLLTPSPSVSLQSPVSNVVMRNERLSGPLAKTTQNTRSAYLDIYDTLDSVALDFDHETLAKKGTALLPDPAQLVSALLDWSSTRYRAGASRIYLAAKVIAHVQQAGHDTDILILRYLGDAKDLVAKSEDHLHRVVIELVRLQAFSVGRYLQWLIASGALYSEERTSATSLIAALPTAGLPVHVVNTRNMLMGRLGYALDEDQKLQSALVEAEQIMASSTEQLTVHLQLLSEATKSTTYSFTRQLVENAGLLSKDPAFSIERFCLVRDLVERAGDINSLATLVSAALSSDVGALLATAADTVNFHAATFAALNQLTSLADGLIEQYLALRPHQPLDRCFIIALAALVERLPGKGSMAKLLADDLKLCESQTSLAACSPASDNVIDMHASKLDSHEDIDSVFASGNVMDEQLMQRIFARVIQRASKPNSADGLTRMCGWLDQLRTVDGSSKMLEGIVSCYLRSTIADEKANAISTSAIACLSLSGCTSLGHIAEMAKDVKDAGTAERLLALFATTVDGLHDDLTASYRLRLQQHRCQDEHGEALIKLVKTALGSSTFDSSRDVFCQLLVRNGQAHEKAIDELFAGSAGHEWSHKNASQLLSALLGQGSNKLIDLCGAIAGATPLSVRFSVLAKHFKASASSTNSAHVKDAILLAFERHSEVWPQLLAVADDDTMRALREKAQDLLLHWAANGTQSLQNGSEDEVKRTFDLLAITSNAGQTPDLAFMGVVAERLRDLHKQLSAGATSSASSATFKEEVFRKLTLVLQLANLTIATVPNEIDATQQSLTHLLQALCALLIHPDLQLHRTTTSYLFDLASTLSDTLPDATLASLKTKFLPNPNLTSILGTTFNSPTAWLGLATQQRAPNKQPQLQPQKSTPRAGPSTVGLGQRGWPGKGPAEVKMAPFRLRQWEMISDPAATVGENDTALSLGLFGVRKV